MVTDSGGDVWLLTINDPPGAATELNALSWNPTTQIVDGYFSFTTFCSASMLSSATINVVIGGRSIRNAYRYAFDVGFTNKSRDPAIRVAYEFETLGKRHIQALEISSDQPNQCGIIPGWETVSSGQFGEQQFQASLNYQFRGASAGGPLNPGMVAGVHPQRRCATTTDTYLRFGLAPMNDISTLSPVPLPGGLPVPELFPVFPITPDDYYACVRNSGYWGDYFGITQFNPSSTSDTGLENRNHVHG